MIVGIPRETYPNERRAALAPEAIPLLQKLGLSVLIEPDAGAAAGFTNEAYRHKGATLASDRAEVFAKANIVAQVRCPGANPEHGPADIALLRADHVLIGHSEPLLAYELNQSIARSGATLFAMELIPRISRAQSMDALSSQANLAGYKAVLLAAEHMRRIYPMMMTAAGTLKPARVFVIGAGVAGLQAIATAKRLGAVVSAIDVRPDVKDQVESLGARFVMPPSMAEGEGGYAKEMTDAQKQEQQKMMADTIAESDVVITTAAIPGRPSPKLIAAETVDRMAPGSVIVDLAAERGGNCALTHPDKIITHHDVTIIGINNVPSLVPQDATTMYAGNITKLLQHIVNKKGEIVIDMTDAITGGTVLCRNGEVVHPRVRELMGLPKLEAAKPPSDPERVEGQAAGGNP
ncbi:MAG: Re/Si-specific NAD(P)(+) transhydrogenase subunit alpha [Planctomycetes bacterium]|nr:Re/Si-specific NAD(P)(+) transhydrogenase subunit alpha [Planctomycetota bacterium]